MNLNGQIASDDRYSPGFMPDYLRKVPIGMEYPGGLLPKTCCADPVRPLTYLACPYSHLNKNVRAVRYVKSTEAAAWLIKKLGWNVFAPITHSHPLATLGGLSGDWKHWETIDSEYLSISERLVVLEIDGWRESVGVQAEIKLARDTNIPIVYMCPNLSVKGSYDLAPYPNNLPAQERPLPKDLDDQHALLYSASGGITEGCPKLKTIGSEAATQQWREGDRIPHEYDFSSPMTSRCMPTSKAATANPKDIIGETKISLSKIPSVALAHCAHAMMDGAKKYDPYNWRAKPVQASIYVDACLRHLLDWFEGEEDAPDSKVHHLGHAMACCAILLDCQEVGNLIDNRPITPKSKGVMTQVLDRLRKLL